MKICVPNNQFSPQALKANALPQEYMLASGCTSKLHVNPFLAVIWIPGYYSTDLVRTLFLCSYGAMGRELFGELGSP